MLTIQATVTIVTAGIAATLSGDIFSKLQHLVSRILRIIYKNTLYLCIRNFQE